MKHNFLAWRFLDGQAQEPTGGDATQVIIGKIKEFTDSTNAQTKAVKDAQELINTELKAAKDDAAAAKLEAKKATDEVELMKKKAATNGFAGAPSIKSFESELFEKINANKEQLGKGAKFGFELGTKAVGNMTSAGNLTGTYFVAPQVVAGIQVQPYNDVHMRNLLPLGTTNSNIIRYVRDNGGEGGPTTVAESATKPQIDRDLSIQDAPVRKIATYFRLPEEMIEDVEYITSFLTQIGTEEVLAVEDTQVLYGDGTGQNLSGLFTNATAFAAPATAIVASPNRFDVLRAARLQIKRAKRSANFALVSPLDYFMMTSVKDSTGNYILQGGGNGLIPTLDGVPVIEMNQVTDGDFLLGDRRAAQIFFRSNISVRFYEQDQDNAIKNLVTIVIEERLALPIYYTSGFVKGTFSTAITDLTS